MAIGRYIDTTSAADGELTVVFGIEVEHDAGVEQAWLQTQCSRHPGFLINREKGFDGRVGNIGGR